MSFGQAVYGFTLILGCPVAALLVSHSSEKAGWFKNLSLHLVSFIAIHVLFGVGAGICFPEYPEGPRVKLPRRCVVHPSSFCVRGVFHDFAALQRNG